MVAKAQSIIVWVLLVVFVGFAVVTLAQISLALLAPSGYPPWNKIVASVALTFFAYSASRSSLSRPATSPIRLGAAASDVPGAEITTALYVAVSLGVFGTLTVDEVIAHGDTALAEAARPVLGDAGFAIMAIAALLATASSVNSNIFAAGNLTLALSELGAATPSDEGTRPETPRSRARGDRAEVGKALSENRSRREDGDRHSSACRGTDRG